jgi:hypothetical protein
MRKRLMMEKIKFYTTLIKEKNELHHNHNIDRTYLSNLDISNFYFNDSSVFDKSNFMTNELNPFPQSKANLLPRHSETFVNKLFKG